ncbi:hypothetical protein HZA87_03760 [Candidatus Uhrbacteria bacterium]|nr:hypothetical protein [Candidatus Uhrbacteria bacterium]
MDKTEGWTTLFSQKPKKGAKFDEALVAISGDKDGPDENVDAALDTTLRDRIGEFLTNADAFCQAHSSDPRQPHWKKLAVSFLQDPVRVTKKVATPKAAPAAEPARAQSPVVATSTQPARSSGVSANALAAAARAKAPAPVRPTLPSAVLPAPVPAPVQPAPPAVVPPVVPPPAVTPSTTVTLPQAAPDEDTHKEDPVAVDNKETRSTKVRVQSRAEALKAARAKALLAAEFNERERRFDDDAAEQKRQRDQLADQEQQRQSIEAARAKALLAAEFNERERRFDDDAAEQKRLKDEAAAERERKRAPKAKKEPAVKPMSSSWVGTAVFLSISALGFAVCVLLFKWAVVDTLMYADASAHAGLQQSPSPPAEEPGESVP